MKRFRKLLVWAHLVIGLTAGTTLPVTVFTGACMAFEEQIIAWAERDLRHVTPPATEAPRLPLDPIIATIRKAQPQAQLASVMVHADPSTTITLSMGRSGWAALRWASPASVCLTPKVDQASAHRLIRNLCLPISGSDQSPIARTFFLSGCPHPAAANKKPRNKSGVLKTEAPMPGQVSGA
jgi:uncharacterized iron-regulated membrane protein